MALARRERVPEGRERARKHDVEFSNPLPAPPLSSLTA